MQLFILIHYKSEEHMASLWIAPTGEKLSLKELQNQNKTVGTFYPQISPLITMMSIELLIAIVSDNRRVNMIWQDKVKYPVDSRTFIQLPQTNVSGRAAHFRSHANHILVSLMISQKKTNK